MKKTLIGLALFSFVCIANAEPARFMLYLSGKEKAIFIFEKDIEKNKKIVRASIQQIGNPRYVKVGDFYSRKGRWEANCAKRTIQVLRVVTYDFNGKPTSVSNAPTDFLPLIPGTYSADFFEMLCDPKFPNIESLTTPIDDPDEYAKKAFKVFEEHSSK
jgi:hypothetical protein